MTTKRELLEAVLRTSWAYLHVDGRREGVALPDFLREPGVTLQIGYDMPLPIPDLAIDDDGVRATLSFRRAPFACRIPWAAIYAISDVDGKGLIFPDDVPPEVTLAPAPSEPPAAPPKPEPEPAKKPRPSHLKLVH